MSKKIAIGDAQNTVVRLLLSSIGGSFSKDDWEKAKNFFGGCAYCGKTEKEVGKLEQDHAIPINYTSLGEHRRGNVVPVCKNCNKEKHRKNYVDYCNEYPDRKVAKQKITKHMKENKYEPLRGNEKIPLFNGDDESDLRFALEMAREEIRGVVEKYTELIQKGLWRKEP